VSENDSARSLPPADRDPRGLSRRHALTGAAGLGLGLPLLAACGGGSEGSGSAASSGPPASGVLGPASRVPVGGGAVFADAKVVVTQPTEGDFRGFSAICTHQGCPVTKVSEGTINCTCHGSAFSIEDGSVQSGPATRPLGEVEVTVADGEISVT
jgi:nitrite reductase/ring-hydroxylating ferredoxin subunit